MAMSTKWDPEALRAGAGVTVTFAAPFLVAARIVGENNTDSALAVVLLLMAIVGFIVGSGVAAWRQRCRTPLSHGIVTAAGTFVIVQGTFSVIKLIRGTDIHWFQIFFTLTVVMFAGMIGGLLGINLQKRGMVPKR
jgi:putative membrane protein (TIGR04086 family)